MSYSSRLLIIAVGGCLIALPAIDSPRNSANNAQQEKQRPPSNSAHENAGHQPLAIIGHVTVTAERENKIEPDWAKPNCKAPTNHDEADLCKQIDVAEAAKNTVTLNIVQVGLGLITLVGLFYTIRYTRITADAAVAGTKVAERALTQLEAPFLAVHFVDQGINAKTVHGVVFNNLRYCIRNYGRTAAHIVELDDFVNCVEIGSQPSPLNPDRRGRPMPYGVIAPPSADTQEFNTVTHFDLFGGESGRNVGDVVNAAFFQGFVRYRDIFDGRYIFGFCFVFDLKGNRWVLMGGEDHNYCRKDDASESAEGVKPSGDPRSVRSSLNKAILNAARKG